MKRIVAALFLALSLPVLAESKIVCKVETEPTTLMHPIMVNGWGGAEIHGNGGAKFYKDVNGLVILSGMVYKFSGRQSTDPTIAPSQDVVAVLPVGYRPLKNEWFKVASQVGEAYVVVFSSGEVQVFVEFGYFTWVSLSGVSFRAQ